MKGLRPLHASPNGENRFANGLKGAVPRVDAPLFFFGGMGKTRLALSGGLKGVADRLGMGHPFYGFENILFRGFGVNGAQPEHLVC